jgi:hypothetical protein
VKRKKWERKTFGFIGKEGEVKMRSEEKESDPKGRQH